MRAIRSLRAGLSMAALGAFLCVASATTVQKLDFKGLTALSTHVVRGTIGSSGFAYTPDGGLIVTLTTVNVTELWKGEHADPTLTVRTPGGAIDRVVIEVPGTPVLKLGEDVLLFLEKNQDGTFGVISFAQGSFKVGRDPADRVLVTRDAGAAHLVATDGRESGVIASGIWELGAVKADVDAALAASAALEDAAAEADANAVPLHDVPADATGGAK